MIVGLLLIFLFKVIKFLFAFKVRFNLCMNGLRLGMGWFLWSIRLLGGELLGWDFLGWGFYGEYEILAVFYVRGYEVDVRLV